MNNNDQFTPGCITGFVFGIVTMLMFIGLILEPQIYIRNEWRDCIALQTYAAENHFRWNSSERKCELEVSNGIWFGVRDVIEQQGR